MEHGKQSENSAENSELDIKINHWRYTDNKVHGKNLCKNKRGYTL